MSKQTEFVKKSFSTVGIYISHPMEWLLIDPSCYLLPVFLTEEFYFNNTECFILVLLSAIW